MMGNDAAADFHRAGRWDASVPTGGGFGTLIRLPIAYLLAFLLKVHCSPLSPDLLRIHDVGIKSSFRWMPRPSSSSSTSRHLRLPGRHLLEQEIKHFRIGAFCKMCVRQHWILNEVLNQRRIHLHLRKGFLDLFYPVLRIFHVFFIWFLCTTFEHIIDGHSS